MNSPIEALRPIPTLQRHILPWQTNLTGKLVAHELAPALVSGCLSCNGTQIVLNHGASSCFDPQVLHPCLHQLDLSRSDLWQLRQLCSNGFYLAFSLTNSDMQNNDNSTGEAAMT